LVEVTAAVGTRRRSAAVREHQNGYSTTQTKRETMKYCEPNLDELPSLESMLKKIEALKPGKRAFEWLVPDRMTFHGRLICKTFPEAVVLDRLLQKGYAPQDCKRQDDGKLFMFEKVKALDASSLRTEPPAIDMVKRVPAFATLAKTAIRLHPRRAVVSDPAASKMGGTFLWPRSEPWPHCDDARHQNGVDGRESPTEGCNPSLVGVVQLNARDFPQVPFPPGTDLLQLLWCPITEDTHDDVYMFPKLFSYWRNSSAIRDPIAINPLPDFMESIFNHFPISCQFHPEAVTEYPRLDGLRKLPNHDELHEALASDKVLWDKYQNELDACPGTKLGGHPYWVQNDDTPTCACNRKMEFLLQLWDWEYTNMTRRLRWIPLSDRWAADKDKWRTSAAAEALLRPPHFDFGHRGYYIFICPQCPERPVRLISQ
jgi:hypothetical protein